MTKIREKTYFGIPKTDDDDDNLITKNDNIIN